MKLRCEDLEEEIEFLELRFEELAENVRLLSTELSRREVKLPRLDE